MLKPDGTWDYNAEPRGPAETCSRCAGTVPDCAECGGTGRTYRLERCAKVLTDVRAALRTPDGDSVVVHAERVAAAVAGS
jgi:hypothetical protein